MRRNEKTYYNFCSCGCQNGIILKADKDGLCLSLVSDQFYIEQESCLSRMREKLRRIWCIIRNKEYCYFEIVMSDQAEIDEFKKFVANI